MSTQKLILTQEVTGLGSSGDTVEFKGGYARNYLLPRGLAIVATRGAEKQVESLRRARAAPRGRAVEGAPAVARRPSGVSGKPPARSGEGRAAETTPAIPTRQYLACPLLLDNQTRA